MPSSSRRGSTRSTPSKKGHREESSDTGSSSETSSSEATSGDEEKRVGRSSSKKKDATTMRSVGKSGRRNGAKEYAMRELPPGRPERNYAPVGNGGSDSDEDSAQDSGEGAVPPQKPARRQPRSTATAQARPGPGGSEDSGHSTLCKVGTALIVVAILAGCAGGGYWFWQRSKDGETSTSLDGNSTAIPAKQDPSVGSVPSAPVSTSAATAVASDQPVSSGAPGASGVPGGNGTVTAPIGALNGTAPISNSGSNGTTTGTNSTDGHPGSYNASAPTGSQGATPTGTATVDVLAGIQKVSNKASWFKAANNVSLCQTKPSDRDYVVHVSRDLFGAPPAEGQRGELCGKWISLWYPKTNQTVNGTIQDLCTECERYQLDVSRAVFYALSDDLDAGLIDIQWWFTPARQDGTYPNDKLETLTAKMNTMATRRAIPLL